MTKCTNCMRGDCCGGDFDGLKAELDTFRDASLLLTGKLEDALAELAALREVVNSVAITLEMQQPEYCQVNPRTVVQCIDSLKKALQEKGE